MALPAPQPTPPTALPADVITEHVSAGEERPKREQTRQRTEKPAHPIELAWLLFGCGRVGDILRRRLMVDDVLRRRLVLLLVGDHVLLRRRCPTVGRLRVVQLLLRWRAVTLGLVGVGLLLMPVAVLLKGRSRRGRVGPRRWLAARPATECQFACQPQLPAASQLYRRQTHCRMT